MLPAEPIHKALHDFGILHPLTAAAVGCARVQLEDLKEACSVDLYVEAGSFADDLLTDERLDLLLSFLQVRWQDVPLSLRKIQERPQPEPNIQPCPDCKGTAERDCERCSGLGEIEL